MAELPMNRSYKETDYTPLIVYRNYLGLGWYRLERQVGDWAAVHEDDVPETVKFKSAMSDRTRI